MDYKDYMDYKEFLFKRDLFIISSNYHRRYLL